MLPYPNQIKSKTILALSKNFWKVSIDALKLNSESKLLSSN